MICETQTAYLLHHQAIGDTSQLLTLLTRDLGLLKLRYKGGRTIKKAGTVQLFTPLIISLQHRHQRLWLQQVELGPLASPLLGDNLICAWYVNELLVLTLKPQEACLELFNEYHLCLLRSGYHQAMRSE